MVGAVGEDDEAVGRAVEALPREACKRVPLNHK